MWFFKFLLLIAFGAVCFAAGKFYSEETSTFYTWKAMPDYFSSTEVQDIGECLKSYPNPDCEYDAVAEYDFDNWILYGGQEKPHTIGMLYHKNPNILLSVIGGPRHGVKSLNIRSNTKPDNAVSVIVDEETSHLIAVQYDRMNENGIVNGQVIDIGLDGQMDRIIDFDLKHSKAFYNGQFHELKYIKGIGGKKKTPHIMLDGYYFELIESNTGYDLGAKYEAVK